MSTFYLWVAVILMANAFLCLYRAAVGPTIQDRIIGINIVNTKTLVVLLLVFFYFGQRHTYLDIVLVYALLNFVITVALSRYIETGRGEIGKHGE